jgi:hypothetical protein
MNKDLLLEINGNNEIDFIRINGIKFNCPNATTDWDKNSLSSNIEIKVGAFSGNLTTDLRTADFEIFKRELKILYDNLDRTAVFEGFESQVIIHVKGDGIGHLIAKCFLSDYVIDGNELKCEIHFDQTQIPRLIDQLEKITNEFPTTGVEKIPD